MGYSSTPRWVLIALLVIAGKSLREASYSELGIPSSFVCLPFYEAELVFFLVFRTKLYNRGYQRTAEQANFNWRNEENTKNRVQWIVQQKV